MIHVSQPKPAADASAWQVDPQTASLITPEGTFAPQLEAEGHWSWRVRHRGRIHRVYLQSYQADTQTITLRVNGKKITLEAQSRLDALAALINQARGGTRRAADLRAPMPGLLRQLLVTEGQRVSKGEPLLVLEAMKMENMLKAPADLTVAKILIEPGVAVEKNQVLLQFG
jgi:acetyl/propionyl-CoA carboxylase alpha subunit